jgi:HD-like signal output (HDOD) protein
MMMKIGMTILALNSPKAYTEILTEFESKPSDLAKLEKEEFELSHIDVGSHIFKVWQMPPIFVKMMKGQGFLQNDFNTADDFDRILRLADILAKRLTKIPFPESEFTLGKLILKHYNAAEETMDVFDEDYYENIKSHPFFSSM